MKGLFDPADMNCMEAIESRSLRLALVRLLGNLSSGPDACIERLFDGKLLTCMLNHLSSIVSRAKNVSFGLGSIGTGVNLGILEAGELREIKTTVFALSNAVATSQRTQQALMNLTSNADNAITIICEGLKTTLPPNCKRSIRLLIDGVRKEITFMMHNCKFMMT